MCARFTVRAPSDAVARFFGASRCPAISARFNIAPGQLVVAARALEGGEVVLDLLRFGLPSREKDRGALVVNARAESVFARPLFREAARRGRCLVPVDGFYEWRTLGKRKEPFFFRLREGGLFALAAVSDVIQAPDGCAAEALAILTTGANALVREVHDRMPAVIRPRDFPLWLDGSLADPARLRPLLTPFPDVEMARDRASPLVNDPRNEGPACLAPEPGRQLGLSFEPDGHREPFDPRIL